jgi:uncharacterized protein with FMN-binding domain
MMKKLLIGAGVLAVVIVMAFLFLTNGLSEGADTHIAGINLSGVPDGDYTGTHEYKRWTNTLVVRVKDHEITSIGVVKDVAVANADYSDEIFSRVISAQNTQIDAMTGATVTSMAYLKAIENAINGKD